MGKPDNLKELIREIFYIENSVLRSKIKRDENVSKYMTESLKDWIIERIKERQRNDLHISA